MSSNRYLIEPMTLGYILKLSQIQITDVVLDLACASGYTTAILSRLAKKVYGIDDNRLLLDQAIKNLYSLNINNAKFVFSILNIQQKKIIITGIVEIIKTPLITWVKFKE